MTKSFTHHEADSRPEDFGVADSNQYEPIDPEAEMERLQEMDLDNMTPL